MSVAFTWRLPFVSPTSVFIETVALGSDLREHISHIV
jgi:hypothetical protein